MNRYSFTAPIFVALSLLFASATHAQHDTLSVNGPKHARHFVNGEKLRIHTAELTVKGPLNIIDDSTISIGSDTVSLGQIESIIGKRRHCKRIVGTSLTAAGTAGDVATVVGIVHVATSSYGGFLGGVEAFADRLLVTLIGVPSIIATTVGVVILIRNKKYRSGSCTFLVH